jgi:hypothetical protein
VLRPWPRLNILGFAAAALIRSVRTRLLSMRWDATAAISLAG